MLLSCGGGGHLKGGGTFVQRLYNCLLSILYLYFTVYLFVLCFIYHCFNLFILYFKDSICHLLSLFTMSCILV